MVILSVISLPLGLIVALAFISLSMELPLVTPMLWASAKPPAPTAPQDPGPRRCSEHVPPAPALLRDGSLNLLASPS